MFEGALIPPNTVITAKGDSPAIELARATSRVFLVALKIEKIVEQESFELSIFGSADSQTWTPKSLLTLPQQFYPGETPRILDLTGQPDIRFVRAHWEVNRWGRGPETPSFEVSASIKEVPAAVLQEAKK
jgi:hypothetical protein